MVPMPSRYRARAAIVAVALVLVAGCGGDDNDPGATTSATGTTSTTAAAEAPRLGEAVSTISSLPGALKRPPPWPANNGARLQLRLRAIGLAPLSEEGQVLHTHQHLDLFVDGKPVPVPANIGIDADGGFISDLHTHETDGIMHVESPTKRDFTLGQFLAVWGLPLSADTIGTLRETGSKTLRVWVNGDEVTADPTRIVLAEHQEIVIAYGTAAQMPDPVPSSFDFEAVGL
jgi:hypothetical protein